MVYPLPSQWFTPPHRCARPRGSCTPRTSGVPPPSLTVVYPLPQVRASAGVVHAAYERRVQQAEGELHRVATARHDYAAAAQRAAAHGAERRALHVGGALAEALAARDGAAARMAAQSRHEQARLGEAFPHSGVPPPSAASRRGWARRSS